jgi:hypothetical protein
LNVGAARDPGELRLQISGGSVPRSARWASERSSRRVGSIARSASFRHPLLSRRASSAILFQASLSLRASRNLSKQYRAAIHPSTASPATISFMCSVAVQEAPPPALWGGNSGILEHRRSERWHFLVPALNQPWKVEPEVPVSRQFLGGDDE